MLNFSRFHLDTAIRIRGLHGEWSLIASGLKDVYDKYQNTALQLQAAHDPPDADSKVRFSLHSYVRYTNLGLISGVLTSASVLFLGHRM